MPRTPAEVFHIAEFLRDELRARRWSWADLAHQMGGDMNLNMATLDFLRLERPDILLGRETAEGLSRALGVDAETLLRLDATWQRGQKGEGDA